ncbi:unnamed protein product [Paramecium pentaurelia]|uniref:Transmembrane protein n=1 Tax=Paramecium pentaurelia TaxID=43138 RepID=A0A8S1XEX4_9CILI|nr:unnamed protein product [Paramecium pentaurelia]
MDQIPNNNQNQGLNRSDTQAIPKNQTGRIIYQTYFCLLGTALLILSIMSYYFYSDAFDNYKYIIENWKQQPIQSIRLSFDKCNNEEINLINYRWPGTVDGCDCRYSFRLLSIKTNNHHTWFPRNKIYNNHACNITQRAWGCISIYAKDAINFNRFPTQNQKEGFKLCAILEKDNSFYSHLPELDECPKGQIKCGNEVNYFYCTSQSECPIFEIGFKDVTLIDNSQEQTEKGLTLLYNRKSEYKLPLVEVRVSEGEGICMKNHLRGLSNGRVEYPLMRENKTECQIDKRFIKLKSSNEVEFYESNNQLKIQDQLRGYEISKQYQWGLYARGYIEWKMSCRGEMFDNFIDQEQILEEILYTQKYLMIVSIIFFIIISVIWSYIQAHTLQGGDWPCIKGRGTEESNTIFYLEILTKIILQSLQAFIIIMSFSRTKEESNFLESVISRNCSDEYVQIQLEYLRDMLSENIYRFNWGCLILFCITTVLDFCVVSYLIISFIRDRKDKENRYEQRDEIKQNYELSYMQQEMGNQNQQQQQQQQQQFNNQSPYFN